VAILPYIEQAALYQQYKFDEPWDSPSNRKVLAQIPPTFRHPSLPQTSVNASYFVLTGPDTMFPTGTKKGIDFAKVSDGLSNTIMVVEAKREIPWTKPEDIPYAKDQPLPTFGGFDEPSGFNAGFGDGSVRFISKNAAETLLRALFTRAGGELIQF
jgi:hypothetical protein